MLQRKKGYVIGLLIVCFTLVTLLSLSHNAAFAQQKKAAEPVKTVILKKEPAGISPNSLKVKLGTTIVWVNSDPEPVTIKFIQKLGIACKVPVNFYADLFGYYETTAIPQAGTASICFIYQGEYDYEVKRLVSKGTEKQGEEISTGKITAEE
jgi:plastocyanin